MKKALVVGIDNYSATPLSGCVNDANEIQKLLETNGDGSPNFDVKFKPNVSYKKEMYELLNSLFTIGESDIALFYFSGHGTGELGGKIVLPDYNGMDLGISMTDILRLVNESKSKNKIIILDCCFSGKMGEAGFTDTADSVIGQGVTIDKIAGHGIFTELLIQDLQGGAADVGGNITPASLYSFVDQSLGAWEQRPLFKTNISRFLPIRSIEPRVSKQTLRKISDYFVDPYGEYKLDPSYEYTNTPNDNHEIKEPYANDDNVKVFKDLQLYESVGLIEPVGTEHMYFCSYE